MPGAGWGMARRAPVFQDHHEAIPLCSSLIATTSSRAPGASFPLTHLSAVTCNGKLFAWSAFRFTFNACLLTFPPNLSSLPKTTVPECPLSSYVLHPCLRVTRVRTSKSTAGTCLPTIFQELMTLEFSQPAEDVQTQPSEVPTGAS